MQRQIGDWSSLDVLFFICMGCGTWKYIVQVCFAKQDYDDEEDVGCFWCDRQTYSGLVLGGLLYPDYATMPGCHYATTPHATMPG